jgi:hypothetical protein
VEGLGFGLVISREKKGKSVGTLLSSFATACPMKIRVPPKYLNYMINNHGIF